MVKIRLKRFGTTKRPVYRIVVIDSRERRDGSPIAEVGFYNPLSEPVELRVDQAAVTEWLKKGAQPTETVKALLKKVGV